MMPVFARDALGLDAGGYGAMVSAIGVGAATAALFMAAVGGRTQWGRVVLGSSVLFGLVLTAAALAPGFGWAIVLFTVAGCLMALNGIAANTMLQRQAPDYLRGRVMGFYSFVVLGMAPLGSLQAGWIAERFGVRAALASGGLVCLAVAALVAWRMRGRAVRRAGARAISRPGERAIARDQGAAEEGAIAQAEEQGIGPRHLEPVAGSEDPAITRGSSPSARPAPS
jgi:MFS family permease